MISRISHISIYVLDQDSALDFYTTKLGMELRTDAKMDNGFRWLTVGPKDQPDVQIVLMPTQSPMMEAGTSDTLRELVSKGTFGAGVLETPDVHAAYEEMKAKGVHFISPPKEQFYGVEALFKDDSGNWFSMTQRPG